MIPHDLRSLGTGLSKHRGRKPFRPENARFAGAGRIAKQCLFTFALGLLAAALPVQASPLKVACIGDSITEGAGLSNPATESYPARLQRLLGPAYLVRNYGVSGRTLLKKGDYPYWKEAAYTQSRNWGPDIVVIKLGTNDSKPYNWKYSTNFVSEFEEFIGSYRSLPSQPRVMLCTPAPVMAKGAFDISPGVVATNIAPAVRDLAARLGLEVIDYHTRLGGHAEWFPDTVHPNTRGMAVMAAIAYGSLKKLPPDTAPIELGVTRSATGRAVVTWPADRATWVLQNAIRADATNGLWTVADPIPATDGSLLRLTNTTTATRFFRLWQP